MKKLLVSMLVFPLLFLSACSLSPKAENGVEGNVVNQENLVGGDRDEHGCIGSAGYSWCELKQKCLRVWEEKCEEGNSLQVTDSVSSEKLGIKVSYYSNPENQTASRVDGDRIYFYMNGPVTTSDYKSGQYLEGFAKAADLSLTKAIEDRFLSDIGKDKCFVTITEDTATYQKAIIDYPDTTCPDGGPYWSCNSCPTGYSKTNGIAYFMYYKDQPDVFFYFSIGQYSLLLGSAGVTSSLEWFNNIEFVK